MVEMATLPEMVRGMKVRSSVKKLCDGCKVCGSRPEVGGVMEELWKEELSANLKGCASRV